MLDALACRPGRIQGKSGLSGAPEAGRTILTGSERVKNAKLSVKSLKQLRYWAAARPRHAVV